VAARASGKAAEEAHVPFLFQNLRVYREALAFADQVASCTAEFRRPGWYVGDQFRRASLSIALNIAESTGRMTDGDRRRFLIMARGSVHECAALLDMCGLRKLLPEPQRGDLEQQLTTISMMLSGMIARYSDGADAVGEEMEEYTA
jgi:four helix bundle protein